VQPHPRAQFLLVVAALVAAGWEGPVSPDYQAGIDRRVAHRGHASIYLKSLAPSAGGDAIRQRIRADAYRGKRIRLTGWVKAEHSGALWLRVDMSNGDYVLDNIVDMPPGDWSKRQLVADVPADALGISFGLRMKGQGQAWADDLSLDVVSTSVPTTTIERRKDHAPGAVSRLQEDYSRAPLHAVNLGFEL
jgi:hypothetical protein